MDNGLLQPYLLCQYRSITPQSVTFDLFVDVSGPPLDSLRYGNCLPIQLYLDEDNDMIVQSKSECQWVLKINKRDQWMGLTRLFTPAEALTAPLQPGVFYSIHRPGWSKGNAVKCRRRITSSLPLYGCIINMTRAFLWL